MVVRIDQRTRGKVKVVNVNIQAMTVSHALPDSANWFSWTKLILLMMLHNDACATFPEARSGLRVKLWMVGTGNRDKVLDFDASSSFTGLRRMI